MHQRLFVSLLLLGLFSSGLAILCDTCHGKCGCLRPVSEECPPDTMCYRQSINGVYMRKGCASSCDEFSQGDCETCTEDNCNRTPRIPLRFAGYQECDEKAVQIGDGVGAIGTGAGLNDPPAGIGHGVVPDGAASTLISSAVAVLSMFYVVM